MLKEQRLLLVGKTGKSQTASPMVLVGQSYFAQECVELLTRSPATSKGEHVKKQKRYANPAFGPVVRPSAGEFPNQSSNYDM